MFTETVKVERKKQKKYIENGKRQCGELCYIILLCTHTVHSSEDNVSGDQSMRLKALKKLVSRPLCGRYFLTALIKVV